jgi:hypothetical protein
VKSRGEGLVVEPLDNGGGCGELLGTVEDLTPIIAASDRMGRAIWLLAKGIYD